MPSGEVPNLESRGKGGEPLAGAAATRPGSSPRRRCAGRACRAGAARGGSYATNGAAEHVGPSVPAAPPPFQEGSTTFCVEVVRILALPRKFIEATCERGAACVVAVALAPGVSCEARR